MFNIHYWTTKDRVINFDIISYYAYLPATFIYKDISLKFIDDKLGEYREKSWPNTTDEGNYVIKTSMGLSFLYSPFFPWVILQLRFWFLKPMDYSSL